MIRGLRTPLSHTTRPTGRVAASTPARRRWMLLVIASLALCAWASPALGITASIVSVSTPEGDAGTTTLDVTIKLSDPALGGETIDIIDAGTGSASAGTDYTFSPTLPVTFLANQQIALVPIAIEGDTTLEPNETVDLALTGASGLTVPDPAGTVTILNDDPPALSVASASATEGTDVTFSVIASQPTTSPITVHYATTTGTAGSGDFTATSGTLSIPAGQTLATIPVPTADDALDEVNETFTLTLDTPSGATIADAVATGTIIDNDPEPTLSIADATTTEGTAAVTLQFTATLSTVSGRDVAVDFATTSGTATAGNDYTAASGTLTIPAGQTSGTVSVTILADALVEATETFSLTLSNPQGATLPDPSALGSIVDLPTAALSPAPSASIGEATTPQSFTVTLNHASAHTVTVAYGTANGTATLGNDYGPASGTGTLTFLPGDLAKSFTVPILADNLNEADETFTVNLVSPSNARLGAATSTITIVDDDALPTLSIANVTVTEGDAPTNAQITVTLAPVSGQTVTVDYQTVAGGSAATPADYGAVSGTLTFNPGDLTKTFNVPIVGDLLDEPTESVNLQILGATNATIGGPTATLFIDDNDPTPSLSVNSVNVTETDLPGVTATFTVSLSAASGFTVTVTAGTSNGSALAGQDYTNTSTLLTFAPGETTKSVVVPIVSDQTHEPTTETFTVGLTGSSGATLLVGTGTGTITDDDPVPTMTIGNASATEASPVQFPVTLSNPTFETVSVNYATAPGTASILDFTGAPGTVTIPPGQVSGTAPVTTLTDLLDEDDETFTAQFSGEAGATLVGSPVTRTGTILDDDPTPALTIADVTVTEGDGGTQAATFTVTLGAVSGRAVSFNFATGIGSATAATDYLAASGSRSIAAGATQATFAVTVNGDVVDELNEQVPIVLSSPINATIGAAPQALLRITDNDTTIVTASSPTIVEGTGGITTLGFSVALSTPNDRTVTVSYATADGSASTLAPADYTAASGNLSFAPGGPAQTVNVAITTDNIDELNESFALNLSNADAAGSPLTVTNGLGTITDDDTASASVNDVTAAEGDTGTSPAAFAVTLTNPSDRTVTVNAAFLDITARSAGTLLDPADYAGTDVTLSFAPGVTNQPVPVTIIADVRDEANETASINLSAPTGGAAVGDGTGVLTITDDDPTPSLAVDNQPVTEGGTVTFTVALSAPSGQTVTVNFTAGGGNATNGVPPADYNRAPGTLTFAPGETSKAIAVPTFDDTLNEPTENFAITLTTATNATIADGTGIGTIDDNDPVNVSIADATMPAEGDSGSTLTNLVAVTLDRQSAQTITVTYTVANGTAVTPADYTATVAPLVFSPGQTSKLIPISVVGDLLDEDNETIAVNLATAVNANLPPVGPTRTGTLTITDDDAIPALSINDQSVTEGATATFTVSLTAASGRQVTVNYSAGGGTATNGAPPADYNRPPGTLTFAAGDTSKTITVPTFDDGTDEPAPDETFTVTLAGEANATLGDAVGAGSIADNDATPIVDLDTSPAVLTAPEGNGGAPFADPILRLDRPSSTTIDVGYAIAGGTATSGVDFTGALTGTVSFAPGDTVATIPVGVVADNVFEPNETFAVTLAPVGVNVVAGTVNATYTLTNDDPQPTISVANVTVTEGTPQSQFSVALSNPSFQSITTTFAVTPGTAATPADFTAPLATGTLTFAPGEIGKAVVLNIVDDLLDEDPETIAILLSAATNATFAGGGATTGASATITDNDLANQPNVSFQVQSPESQLEGNSGATSKDIVIQLTGAGGAPQASGRNVTVTWQTAEDPLLAPNAQLNDYSAVGPTPVVFSPGQVTKVLTLFITGDVAAEPTESIAVVLSNPLNTTLIGSSTKQIVILDDDHINQPPFANADTVTVARNTSASINVRANDTDPDLDAMTVTSNTPAAHGLASCQSTGVCIYTPSPGYSGPDSFTYVLSDFQATSTGTVNITVVNALPVANADAIVTGQGTPGSVNVLANDTDPDGTVLSLTSSTGGAHGAVACGGAICNYVPAPGFIGADAFTYTVADADGATAVGTVNVTVAKGQPLTISAVASGARAKRGAKSGYTVTIRNPNATPVTLTAVSVCIPKGFTYAARSATGPLARVPAKGTCGAGKTKLTWAKRVVVPAKGSVALRFKVTVGGALTTTKVTATAKAGDGFAVTPAKPSAPIKIVAK